MSVIAANYGELSLACTWPDPSMCVDKQVVLYEISATGHGISNSGYINRNVAALNS